MKKPLQSPCKLVCRIERSSGLCIGCLRTTEEIRNWIGYSEQERDTILHEISSRNHNTPVSSVEQNSQVTTKKGDDGHTEILFGRRIPKWDLRIRSIGKMDMVASQLRIARAHYGEVAGQEIIDWILLYTTYIMAELACDPDDWNKFEMNFHSVSDEDMQLIERRISALGTTFIGWNEPLSLAASHIDHARAILRSAEVDCWELIEMKKVRSILGCFLNRLADYLWKLSHIQL